MNGKRQQIISASLLINELCDQDIEKRINAISSLRTIGTALGNNRIRNQLIPFLREYDQSRVLIMLLNNLICLGQIMGGGISFTYLFTILQDTMQNQEEKVRKKAIETYYEAIQRCNIQKFENQIINSLKNILNFDFNEGKQGFFTVVSGKLGKFSANNQQFLLTQYQSMAQGNIFPLRKFSAAYSQKLAQWLSQNQAGILKIVQILFKDKQQSNKIFLIDTIIAVAKFKNHTFLQPYFNLISYQFTWRIRYELISKVDILAQVLGSIDKFKPFLTYFIKYINDIEPQIRSISCLKLQSVTNFVSSDDIINRIIPALKNIPQDSNVYVRNSLASSLLSLCSPLGKKNTSQFILPKFLQLLKDDEVQVRLTMFSKIDQICSVLGTQTLSQTTIPALHQLATSSNWRIRVSSMDMLLYFIKKSGMQFMSEKNFKLILDYINDKANAVRKQGIKLIIKIQLQLGTNWIEKHFFPKIFHLHKAKSYIQRQTFLDIANAIIPNCSDDCCNKQILPIVINSLCSDIIENVRINVCIVLKTLYKRGLPQKQTIKKQLRILTEDKDKDVKEMAQKTLKNIDN